MQHNIEEIRRRLLSCIDSQHNVTDMSQCLEIISLLERTAITRELLEATRLGKHINDIRRKTSHQELYRRAKDLVRKWRRMYVLPEGVNGATPAAVPAGPGPGSGAGPGGGGGGNAGSGNGHPPVSPSSLPSSCNTSPGLSRPSTPSTIPSRSRNLSPTLTTPHAGVSNSKPYSPALSGLNRGLSPAVNRKEQRSPCVSPSMANAKQRSKSQTPHSPAINKSQTVESRADASSYAMSSENVAKSNTANKRLRKDDYENSSDIPSVKRAKNSIPHSSVITNGQVDEEWSRDSFSSILSNDNKFNQTSVSSENNNKSISKRTLNSGLTPVAAGKQKLHKQTPITPKQEPKSHKQDSNKISSVKSAKVKTTSQLVQDLADRKGDQKLAERAVKLEAQQMRELTQVVPATDPEVISRNKREHMEKFLKSQPDVGFTDRDDVKSPSYSSDGAGAESAPAISPPPSPGGQPLMFPVRQIVSNLDLLGVGRDETAEEILARLPPIDLDSIVWDDEPEEEQQEKVKEDGEKIKKSKSKEHDGSVASGSDEGSEAESEVDETERILEGASKVEKKVVETLHSTNVDCQNGNFDNDGKFREWHEVYNKKAYQDELLPVLPYVITDY